MRRFEGKDFFKKKFGTPLSVFGERDKNTSSFRAFALREKVSPSKHLNALLFRSPNEGEVRTFDASVSRVVDFRLPGLGPA